MALFNKPKETLKLKKHSFEDKNVLYSYLKAVLKLGDIDDYRYLSKEAATIFFEENKRIFENFHKLSNDNLEMFLDVFNCFLSKNYLGNMDMEIMEHKGEVLIEHFHSPFINIIENDVSCEFLSKLYSEVFSMLLEEKVEAKEISCGGENEKCIFKITV